MRKLGITIDTFSPAPGDCHLLQFYSDKQDLVDLIPYFQAGLENGEFCIWLTSEPLSVTEAIALLHKKIENFDSYLQNGQIEIKEAKQWYLEKGEFNIDRVLQLWSLKFSEIQQKGFQKIRAAGVISCWLTANHWSKFMDYERQVNKVCDDKQFLAICCYPQNMLNMTQMLAVIALHSALLIKNYGAWQLTPNCAHKDFETGQLEHSRNFKFIFENSADGMLLTDPETRQFILANPAMQTITGYTPQELLTMDVSKLHLEKDLTSVFNELAQHATGQKNLSKNIPILRKDKTIIYCDVKSSGVLTFNHRSFLLGMFRDVTERKQHADELELEIQKRTKESDEINRVLKESEIRFKTFVDFAYDWQTWLDPEEKYVYISPACERVTGYSRDAFLKDSQFLKKIIHPDDYEMAANHGACQNKPHHVEFRLTDAKGEQRYIDHICHPVYGEDGSYLGRRGSDRDITDRKKAEIAVRESEKRYRLLSSISPVGIFHLNTKGNCLYANLQFTEFTALTTEEAYPVEGWGKTIHPDDLERVKSCWYEAVADEKQFQAEFRFCKPDASIVRVFAQIIAVRGEEGQVNSFIGTLTNITEQYALAKKIRLQQQQLARIGRDRAMGEVASNLAHQLNQPLAVISSYAQQLAQKLMVHTSNSDNDINEIAAKIVANSNRASNVVQNMRDFCATGLLNKNQENINDIIFDAVQMLDQKDLGNSFVKYNLIEPSPILSIDKTQISQILINILQNAVDAMSAEATSKKLTQITITTIIKNCILTISIEDSGPGFSTDLYDKLFEPFFSTKSDGMGIGLAICYSIVEAHGGQLFATSDVGKGAQFNFTLPMCES